MFQHCWIESRFTKKEITGEGARVERPNRELGLGMLNSNVYAVACLHSR